jgi:hypothetical protein
MNTRNIALVAVAALLLTTTAISSSASTYSVAAYKKNQATSQANACGNDFLPTNIGCENTGSQIQGDENSVALAAQQTFPEIDREKDHQRDHHKPVPPPKVNCPVDYVWDLTLDEPLAGADSPDIPTGTVLCSFNGVGPDPQTVQIEGTEIEFPVAIRVPQDDFCESDSRAHASSGTLPDQLEIGDLVCVEDLRPT